jgi:hypothetical protein
MGRAINVKQSTPAINGNSNVLEKAEAEQMRWAEMQVLWQATREEISGHLADVRASITDGRTLRRYDGLSGWNYDNIVLKLYENDHLNEVATDAALGMNYTFNSKKSHKNVSPEDLKNFKEWRREWASNYLKA